jgi:hypothetical protein
MENKSFFRCKSLASVPVENDSRLNRVVIPSSAAAIPSSLASAPAENYSRLNREKIFLRILWLKRVPAWSPKHPQRTGLTYGILKIGQDREMLGKRRLSDSHCPNQARKEL